MHCPSFQKLRTETKEKILEHFYIKLQTKTSAVENCKIRNSWCTRRCLCKKKSFNTQLGPAVFNETHTATENESDERTLIFTNSTNNYKRAVICNFAYKLGHT
jgi:hypothetical protein